jgi:nitroreductase
MIRGYDEGKQISDEIIMKLIRNAHRAASTDHTQVQEFIFMNDPTMKSKLRMAAVNQEYIEKAPVLVVACTYCSVF